MPYLRFARDVSRIIHGDERCSFDSCRDSTKIEDIGIGADASLIGANFQCNFFSVLEQMLCRS